MSNAAAIGFAGAPKTVPQYGTLSSRWVMRNSKTAQNPTKAGVDVPFIIWSFSVSKNGGSDE